MSERTSEGCRNCDGQEWVCENHTDRPWEGMSTREDACSCGAGMPCPVCRAVGHWHPIRCYNEKYDGLDVLICGGTYCYDAETFPVHRPFPGASIARRPDRGSDEWRGGYGSEYDGQHWHRPEWFMRIPPLPHAATHASPGVFGTKPIATVAGVGRDLEP